MRPDDRNSAPISKALSKKIKINTLTVDKNMAQIAADIVGECKSGGVLLIHPSRVEEIEQLLVTITIRTEEKAQ
jgi:NADH/NAD ratio-sensing transcriptional regulator Rex